MCRKALICSREAHHFTRQHCAFTISAPPRSDACTAAWFSSPFSLSRLRISFEFECFSQQVVTLTLFFFDDDDDDDDLLRSVFDTNTSTSDDERDITSLLSGFEAQLTDTQPKQPTKAAAEDQDKDEVQPLMTTEKKRKQMYLLPYIGDSEVGVSRCHLDEE
ncbi:hypothetical protein QZH41_000230 [Actinostola sp. cb2023]|nr:hypothetical protein QZH41_000230 [Actinostola sp. cb2023]